MEHANAEEEKLEKENVRCACNRYTIHLHIGGSNAFKFFARIVSVVKPNFMC